MKAYEQFDERHHHLRNDQHSSVERVHLIIQQALSPLSKSELMILCPQLSRKTMERALNYLENEGLMQMTDSGRNTRNESV